MHLQTNSECGGPWLLSLNAYHYRRGGADNVYLDHADLMRRNGWSTAFFSMHHDNNIASSDQVYFAEEINFQKKSSLIKRFQHAVRIVYSHEARVKIGRLLDDRPISLAHVHSIYHHQSPSVLLELKKRNIPTVMTTHDLKLACPAYTMLNKSGICERCKGARLWNVVRYRCIKNSTPASALIAIESALHKITKVYVNNVDLFIAPSAFYKKKLIEWGLPPDRIRHVPNFVPDAPPHAPRVGGDYILYFGRLSREKGLATLIKASKIANAPIRVVGTGPQEAELRTLADTLRAPVEFWGFQTGSDLWRSIDGARAVVLPSEWYENGPLSALEAMQRGKPLIGADVGGIPELIVENETGWLFESGNADDLSRVLRRVFALDPLSFADMARRCQDQIKRNNSESVYLKTMLEIYRDLLALKDPGLSKLTS